MILAAQLSDSGGDSEADNLKNRTVPRVEPKQVRTRPQAGNGLGNHGEKALGKKSLFVSLFVCLASWFRCKKGSQGKKECVRIWSLHVFLQYRWGKKGSKMPTMLWVIKIARAILKTHGFLRRKNHSTWLISVWENGGSYHFSKDKEPEPWFASSNFRGTCYQLCNEKRERQQSSVILFFFFPVTF